MPVTKRPKIKTNGYAARRSSFETASIGEADCEAMPVIVKTQISGRNRLLFPVNLELGTSHVEL
jgi:hypothetical protein